MHVYQVTTFSLVIDYIPSLKELSMIKYKESLPSGWNSASFVASLKLMYELTPESDRLLKDVAIKAAGENA